MRRWKFLVGALVVVLALGYLGYRGFEASATYYLTVGEFLNQNDAMDDEQVRLGGSVAPGTIEQSGLNLKFNITDGEQEIPVVYQGAVPDAFRAGGEVTVEGKLNTSGVFEAKTLLAKCASRYTSA